MYVKFCHKTNINKYVTRDVPEPLPPHWVIPFIDPIPFTEQPRDSATVRMAVFERNEYEHRMPGERPWLETIYTFKEWK